MAVLRMLTQGELEREKYEARLKYQRDEPSRRHEAEQREKRILEAEQRAHEAERRGELLGCVRLAERLLKQEPIPKETLQAMTSEQLQELAERHEAQLIGQA
jgi:hypothetical protein